MSYALQALLKAGDRSTMRMQISVRRQKSEVSGNHPIRSGRRGKIVLKQGGVET